MSLFDSAMTVIGAIGSGGITGLLGGALTAWQKASAAKTALKEKQLDHQHALNMADKELEQLRLEADRAIQVTEREAAAIEYRADREALARSLEAATRDIGDTSREGIVLRFIEGMRRAVRPIASYWAMGFILAINAWLAWLWYTMQISLTPEQAYDLGMQVLSADLYLSTTVLLWWFSTRGVGL